jgi:ribulose-phosphate 3-epimerase
MQTGDSGTGLSMTGTGTSSGPTGHSDPESRLVAQSGNVLGFLRAARPAVLPSLLLCDFGNLEAEVRRLEQAGVQALHLDVMDGHFVENFTYGMPIVAAIRRLTSLPLDVHLMIARPERYLAAFRDAGADILTVHWEAVEDVQGVLAAIRRLGAVAGLAFNPHTSLEGLLACRGSVDLVLVMSVNAGFGGQKFLPVALERLRWVRQHLGPGVLLEVDGGISQDNIRACVEAGADLMVVGSAIFRSPDYRVAVRELNGLIAAGKHGVSVEAAVAERNP